MVQKINPKMYRVKYPCWLFNTNNFLEFMDSKYNLILEFDALGRANIPSKYKDFIFRKK